MVGMVSWKRSTVSQRSRHSTKYSVLIFLTYVQEAGQLLFTVLLIDSSNDKLLLRYSIPDLPVAVQQSQQVPLTSMTFSHAPQVMNASNEEWDGVPAKTFQREV